MQCRIPLESRCVPGVGGSERTAIKTANEIDGEEDLNGGEEDGGFGDLAVEGERAAEEMAGGTERTARAGDAGELGVVAGFSGEAGDVHGEEGGVGTDES